MSSDTTTSGLMSRSRRALPSTVRPRTRNRSWGLVVLAALLVVGAGLAVTALVLNAGERAQVLAISPDRGPIAKGQVVGREDLVTRPVAGVDGAFDVADVDQVVGQTAAIDLLPGQVLTEQMVTSGMLPDESEAIIGLALDPNRVPSGLEDGDTVNVIVVPAGTDANNPETIEMLDQPEVIAGNAVVSASSGETVAGGQVLVTLVVDVAAAHRAAAYSTQNRLALVKVAPSGAGPRGQ